MILFIGLIVAIAMIFIIPNVETQPDTEKSGVSLTFIGLVKVKLKQKN